MDLESSETAARGMPGGEPTSGMAEPNHEEISSSSSSSTNHISSYTPSIELTVAQTSN